MTAAYRMELTGEAIRCAAHRRNGDQCGNDANPFQQTCYMHGGNTPAALESARVRGTLAMMMKIDPTAANPVDTMLLVHRNAQARVRWETDRYHEALERGEDPEKDDLLAAESNAAAIASIMVKSQQVQRYLDSLDITAWNRPNRYMIVQALSVIATRLIEWMPSFLKQALSDGGYDELYAWLTSSVEVVAGHIDGMALDQDMDVGGLVDNLKRDVPESPLGRIVSEAAERRRAELSPSSRPPRYPRTVAPVPALTTGPSEPDIPTDFWSGNGHTDTTNVPGGADTIPGTSPLGAQPVSSADGSSQHPDLGVERTGTPGPVQMGSGVDDSKPVSSSGPGMESSVEPRAGPAIPDRAKTVRIDGRDVRVPWR